MTTHLPTRPENDLRWNQGSLLTREAVTALSTARVLPSEWEDEGYAVVVTHPCDLTASEEAEPYIEFVLARQIRQSDGNYHYGKSARTLHLDAAIDDCNEILAISIHDHARVKRLDLSQPSAQLDRGSSRLIARWMSRRYTRPAFPDTFNRRVSFQRDQIRKLLKGDGHHISGIYINLSTEEELDDTEAYVIALRATMEVDDHDIEELRIQCQGVTDKLAELFNTVDGVEVDDHELCDESSMSLDDLRFYLHWDVDDLSLRDEDAALAPEG